MAEGGLGRADPAPAQLPDPHVVVGVRDPGEEIGVGGVIGEQFLVDRQGPVIVLLRLIVVPGEHAGEPEASESEGLRSGVDLGSRETVS